MKILNLQKKMLITLLLTIAILCMFSNISKAATELRGRVFDDLNGNGILDEGEPGVANVIVLLNVAEAPKVELKTEVSAQVPVVQEPVEQYIPSQGPINPGTQERPVYDDGYADNIISQISQIDNSNIENDKKTYQISDLMSSAHSKWINQEISEEDYLKVIVRNNEILSKYDAQEAAFGMVGNIVESTENQITDVYSYMTLTDENGYYVFNPGKGAGTYEMMFLYGGREQLKISPKYNAHDYEATHASPLDGILENKSYFIDDLIRREEVNAYVNGEIEYDVANKLSALDGENLLEKDFDIAEATYMKTEVGSFIINNDDDIVENLNLGLRERKTVEVNVNKYLSRLEVILSSGECLISVNFDENGNFQNGVKEVKNIMMLPDDRIVPIIDDDIIHGATLKAIYNIRVETIARGYWENEDEKENFTRITLYEYLDGGMQTNSEGWYKVNESECKKLVPEKNINTIYCTNLIMNADDIKELEVEATAILTTGMDYKFDSNIEVVSYENVSNRRMYKMLPGNFDKENVKENDESKALRLVIMPPL